VDDIKKAIVARRLQRIATEGFTFGHPVPLERRVPLVPFDRPPFVICEVKRRSPSKGVIAEGLDAVGQARLYVESGIKTISVLTEEDHFGGSLADLMAAKEAFPQTAFLRKDFLVRREDLEVSWRAGADAVLLIASILTSDELADLNSYAEHLGLSVFVEVHDESDVAKARPLRPAYTGINCRDLTDFSIDRAIPLMTRKFVDWPTRLVFESGIFRLQEAEWVARAGFQGLLVGEGAVKDTALAGKLAHGFVPASFQHPDPEASFWAKLYARLSGNHTRPMVKICGLAHYDDVLLADELGADLLGFILASSKRQVDASFVRRAPRTKALKVGVVQLAPGEALSDEIAALVEEGFLDALQFHGQEDFALVDAWADRGYKALALDGPASWSPWLSGVAPRILADAGTGGTGRPVTDEALTGWASTPFGGSRLWLAGGLSAENIAERVQRWRPELVDASSGLEESPGHKDPAKLRHYFKEIDRVCF